MLLIGIHLSHWRRKVVKSGGANRQTRKYCMVKIKSYGALLTSGGAAAP